MRTHLSVVGSGPILHPMNSSPSRYLVIRERVLSIDNDHQTRESPDECRLASGVLAH